MAELTEITAIVPVTVFRRTVAAVLLLNQQPAYANALTVLLYATHILASVLFVTRWCNGITGGGAAIAVAQLVSGLDVAVLLLSSLLDGCGGALRWSPVFAIDFSLWASSVAISALMVSRGSAGELECSTGLGDTDIGLLQAGLLAMGFRVASRIQLFRAMRKFSLALGLDRDTVGAARSKSSTTSASEGGGGVAIGQVRAAITSYDGLSPALVARLNTIVDEADTDHDGMLSSREYLDLMPRLLSALVALPTLTRPKTEIALFEGLASRLRSLQTGKKPPAKPPYGTVEVLRSACRVVRSEWVLVLCCVLLMAIGKAQHVGYMLESEAQLSGLGMPLLPICSHPPK